MKVMTLHEWFDNDIKEVCLSGHENNREIVFNEKIETVLINKEDVIALAKEFNLVVYEKTSAL